LEFTPDHEKFLNVLKKLGGSMGQIALRRSLRWSKIRFDQIKRELQDLKVITLGKGRGGSIQLFEMSTELSSGFQFPLTQLNNDETQFEKDLLVFQLPQEGSWEQEVVECLQNSLSLKDLIFLVGSEIHNLLVSKIRSIGQDRKPNKLELSIILLQIYNRDLLFSPDIAKSVRELLAKANDLYAPKRLVPGKKEALQFVRNVGLPIEMAGEPKEDDRDPFIIIKAKENEYKPLQSFQLEIVDRAIEIFSNSNTINQALVSLPTGAGKTRTAVEIIHRWMNNFISSDKLEECSLTIWIAQTDELCEQAFNQFKEVWENNPQKHPTKIIRMWGSFWIDSKEEIWDTVNQVRMPVIMICTINTLYSLILQADKIIDKALAQSIKDQCDFIVIDEAHHAAAKTYQQVFEEISNHRYHLKKLNILGVNLLGLTATPYRNVSQNGTEELQKIFKNILIPKKSFPILDEKNPVRSLKKYLQDLEILSVEKIEIINTSIKISLDEKGAVDDLYAKKLSDSSFRHKRREFIVDHILQIIQETRESSIIYFGPTVEDAKVISAMLKMEGASSAFVGDKLNLSVREQVISDFRNGKHQILCNCRILTAGFDAPKITHVVIGWPTDSTILFHQIIGRGLRGPKFGGTSKCIVKIFTDEVDNMKDHNFAHIKYFEEWEI